VVVENISRCGRVRRWSDREKFGEHEERSGAVQSTIVAAGLSRGNKQQQAVLAWFTGGRRRKEKRRERLAGAKKMGSLRKYGLPLKEWAT
jgi:hypothetical protein